MSVSAIEKAFKLSNSKGYERLVLLKIADSTGDNYICWPSLKTICEETNIPNKRTVSKHIASLENRGEIVRVQRTRKNGSQTSNYYIFCLGQTIEEIKSKMVEFDFSQEEVTRVTKLVSEKSHPPHDSGVTPPMTDKSSPHDSGVTPPMTDKSSPEPSLEPSVNRKGKGGGKSPAETPPHYQNNPLSIEPEVQSLVELLAVHCQRVKYNGFCESARDLLSAGIAPDHYQLQQFVDGFWPTWWQSKDQAKPYPSHVFSLWANYEDWIKNPVQSPKDEYTSLVQPLIETLSAVGRDAARELLRSEKYKPIRQKMTTGGIASIERLRSQTPDSWARI